MFVEMCISHADKTVSVCMNIQNSETNRAKVTKIYDKIRIQYCYINIYFSQICSRPFAPGQFVKLPELDSDPVFFLPPRVARCFMILIEYFCLQDMKEHFKVSQKYAAGWAGKLIFYENRMLATLNQLRRCSCCRCCCCYCCRCR